MSPGATASEEAGPGSRAAAGRAWLWLFPATYLVHVAEEYWAGPGFYRWVAELGATPMSPERFLLLNAVGLGMMVAAVALALGPGPFGWVPISLATVVLLNGALHLVASGATLSYSPGTVSGTVLWLPLGFVTLARGWPRAKPATAWAAVGAGLAAHAVVSWLALSGRVLP